jgi:hypothetical protein
MVGGFTHPKPKMIADKLADAMIGSAKEKSLMDSRQLRLKSH